jgi:hypothetical protein
VSPSGLRDGVLPVERFLEQLFNVGLVGDAYLLSLLTSALEIGDRNANGDVIRFATLLKNARGSASMSGTVFNSL